MDVNEPLPLLGGLSPQQFMRRHWHKKPLLVRQALAQTSLDSMSPVSRNELFQLAATQDVESRLVVRTDDGWRLRHGPFSRRALPALARPDWTLLVQGLDLHVPAAHELLSRFRFVPDARLDDLMVSYASDGGGVGPHLDAYDVFLIQVQGSRRWRIGRVPDDRLVEGLPLKILKHFQPEQEWVLAPGDMLYLPPRWGHDGVAVGGDCMTCSVGFRAPSVAEVAGGLLGLLAETVEAEADPGPGPGDAGSGGSSGTRARPARRYRDPRQSATASPARVPTELQRFARKAVEEVLSTPGRLEAVLGEWLTEPKPRVWFEGRAERQPGQGVCLDPRTRMMYDAGHVFINGESFRAGGRDARLMQKLADDRALKASQVAALSLQACDLLDDWVDAGWLHTCESS